jgi:hypothetical protein
MKIVITKQVQDKIKFMLDKYNSKEWTAYGSCYIQDNFLYVDEVKLPRNQKNTGATTDVDKGDVADLFEDFELREKDMRVWLHSHASMGVFFSKTDDEMIAELSQHGWICAVVVNNKFEFKGGFGFQHEMFGNHYTDAEVLLEQPELDKDLLESWEKEYKESLGPDVPVTTGIQAPYAHGYGWQTNYYEDYNSYYPSPPAIDVKPEEKSCDHNTDFINEMCDMYSEVSGMMTPYGSRTIPKEKIEFIRQAITSNPDAIEKFACVFDSCDPDILTFGGRPLSLNKEADIMGFNDTKEYKEYLCDNITNIERFLEVLASDNSNLKRIRREDLI